MAKPIEATPVLDNEEWDVFIKTIQNNNPTKLKKHSVNINAIREILKDIEKKDELRKLD